MLGTGAAFPQKRGGQQLEELADLMRDPDPEHLIPNVAWEAISEGRGEGFGSQAVQEQE